MHRALVHKPSKQVVVVFTEEPQEGEYGLFPVEGPIAPPGNHIATEFTFKPEQGVVERSIIELGPLSPREKLDRMLAGAGLTLGELKALLAITSGQAILAALIDEIAPDKPGLTKRLQDRAIEIVRAAGAPPQK